MIKANKLKVPESSTIHPSVIIECDEFVLGENCYIGHGTKITCKSFTAGDYLYISGDVEIGRGGCTGPNSNVRIGNHVGIFENTVLNPSEEIVIGDDVGIGAECLLWAHGAWLNVLDGYPVNFGPIHIGDRVWLPARNVVLPNVTIGNDCVISTNSVVNRDIPSGSLAAGNPCKVIKENYFPKVLSLEEKRQIISKIISNWLDLLDHKNCKSVSFVDVRPDCTIKVVQGENRTIIDPLNKKIEGPVDEVIEDLRDLLRRNGIKIYTGNPFKSLRPHYQTLWT